MGKSAPAKGKSGRTLVDFLGLGAGSISEIAQRSGVSQSYLSYINAKKRGWRMSAQTARRLAPACGLTVEQLLEKVSA